MAAGTPRLRVSAAEPGAPGGAPLAGSATADGTERFAARRTAAAGHFRPAQGWIVSSIGLGTHQGADDDATDARYTEAIAAALGLGCNVIDTAITYRHQRSERVVGATLAALVQEGVLRRDEVVIGTKGGYIPFDSQYRDRMHQYFEDTFLKPRVFSPGDVVAGRHCIASRYLRHQLDASRRNLGCACIDIYYLHDLEVQRRERSQADFWTCVRLAFAALEAAVADGVLRLYGVSSWTGFRARPDAPDYLALAELVDCAREVGGERHHFRFIQLPVTLAMPEGFAQATQPVRAGRVAPVAEAAQALGLSVVASAPLWRGRLATGLPPNAAETIDRRLESDAQRALQFARSVPGVATALVGTRTLAHVHENMALARVPPLVEDAFWRCVSRLYGEEYFWAPPMAPDVGERDDR